MRGPMNENQPPLEYLVTSSQTAVESFELSRLNRVSNLRKEIRQIVDEWIAAETEARIARWILDCRRAQTEDEVPLHTSALGALPATPPAPAAEPQRRDPLPMEEIPLGAPCGAELPLRNSTVPMVEGKLPAPFAEVSKCMKSHTAKAVLQLLEHLAGAREALSAPMQIRQRRPQACAVRAPQSEIGLPGSYNTAERRNCVGPRIPLQSLATANPLCSQPTEEQGIRPAAPIRAAAPLRSVFSGAEQCNRRRAS
jgi:hypothetical protein